VKSVPSAIGRLQSFAGIGQRGERCRSTPQLDGSGIAGLGHRVVQSRSQIPLANPQGVPLHWRIPSGLLFHKELARLQLDDIADVPVNERLYHVNDQSMLMHGVVSCEVKEKGKQGQSSRSMAAASGSLIE
jgi:hypothetical protein